MKALEIRDLRKRLKLTQKELAARLKVDLKTVKRWELEEQRPSPQAERQMARLANKVK